MLEGQTRENHEEDYFKYGEKEIQYLKEKDPVLGKAIDEIGLIKRSVIPDLYMALLNAIVGQQISSKAQKTVWERMQKQFAPLTPENIGKIPVEELQTCGISMRKATYIKDLTDTILRGELDLEMLPDMSDEEVCKELVKLKGIGVWTAEMLMTFSMQRMNIMSWDDLAIQRGLRMLYRHRKITRELFAKYKRRYSPYATVASLYLWAIAGGAIAGLTDPAPKTPTKKKEVKKKQHEDGKDNAKS